MQKTILIISLVALAGCWKSDFKSLKALAEKGVPRAQHELGRMYHDGTEVEQNFKESFKWTRKAAEQNHPLAQYELGFMYEYGEGTEEDFVLAYVWHNIAPDLKPKIIRDIAGRMTREQIAEAKVLVEGWQQKFKADNKGK